MKYFLVFYLLMLTAATPFSNSSTSGKELFKILHAEKSCSKIDAVAQIISEAIAIGAPTYNQGNHIGCYRIYEGAAYKILHKYGSKCKDVKNTLETALEKSYGDYSASERAWIMRMAFDAILGVPTVTK